jgi:hypothetical protein
LRFSSAALWRTATSSRAHRYASIKVIPDTFAQDADRMARFAEGPETNYLTDHYRDYPVVLVRLCKIRIDHPSDDPPPTTPKRFDVSICSCKIQTIPRVEATPFQSHKLANVCIRPL